MVPMSSENNTSTTMKIKGGSITMATKSVATTRSSSSSCCCLMAKLMRKLLMKRSHSRIRQGSFQCCYDPLSYSLNFDTSDCGSLLDEDYYYKFCAFSSRFVANPTASCHVLQVASRNSQ
ncbi:hypothetical protein KIW84_072261 [Lathyrus oleraceus]|uniref:Uncharacterized protein n=1 Tax=Pisum sativum TaxID=3888 RepID=A0A9D4VMV3_PEA|nr:hypothetical protein KIW84_072261 [Pisum sativum]